MHWSTHIGAHTRCHSPCQCGRLHARVPRRGLRAALLHDLMLGRDSYVFAASELGIRHEIWSLQSVPKVHVQLDTPIIHFHVDVPLSNGAALE